MPRTEAIAEPNAVEVPLYTSLDVARYLRVPVWVAIALSGRHRFHPEEMFEYFHRGPLFAPRFGDDYGLPFRHDEPRRVSFRTLATLFVRSFLFGIPPSHDRVAHWHPDNGRRLFESAFEALRAAESEPSWFADPDLILAQFERHTARFGGPDRQELQKLVALHVDRVESKDGVPVRLFPFSRDPAPDVPRFVVIDPDVRFGRPTVKGAPTDVLAERWRAGDAPSDLAEDYGLTTDEVDEALRYESAPSQHPLPFPLFGW